MRRKAKKYGSISTMFAESLNVIMKDTELTTFGNLSIHLINLHHHLVKATDPRAESSLARMASAFDAVSFELRKCRLFLLTDMRIKSFVSFVDPSSEPESHLQPIYLKQDGTEKSNARRYFTIYYENQKKKAEVQLAAASLGWSVSGIYRIAFDGNARAQAPLLIDRFRRTLLSTKRLLTIIKELVSHQIHAPHQKAFEFRFESLSYEFAKLHELFNTLTNDRNSPQLEI